MTPATEEKMIDKGSQYRVLAQACPILNQSGHFDLPSGVFDEDMKAGNFALGLHMAIVSVPSINRLIFAAAICAAISGGTSAPSSAADYGPDLVPVSKHARVPSRYWNWRDRCAWAGYYCLYVWHGYLYHYRWDDLDYGYAYYSRRHRRF